MCNTRYAGLLAAGLLSLTACGQPAAVKADTSAVRDTLVSLSWTRLADGVDYCETDAPEKSIVNDSKLTVLRIDPQKVEFEMHCATGHDRQPRTAVEWADSFDLDIVFNAGMYDLAKPLVSRGYLKSGDHVNQAAIHPTFNAMLALHATDTTKVPLDIIDLQCENWSSVKTRYRSYAQGLRMLDCNGMPLSWSKKKQSCSMLVAAKDENGYLFLVFTRSPYLHDDMIRFLQRFPVKLTNAIYLEGGPETSLYVNIGDTKLEKMGSYVSKTYENDKNDRFWPLPNVIGIRVRH